MLIDNFLFPEKNGRYSYPFDMMTIGEGFILLHRDAKNSARVSANHYAKLHPGWRFAIIGHDKGWQLLRTA